MIPPPPTLTRRDALRSFGLLGAATLLAPALTRPAAASSAGSGTTPTLAGAQPGFYRTRVGAFEAVALNDGGGEFPPSVAWPSSPPEQIAASLQAAALPREKVYMPFDNLLVKMGSELVLVDAGCGTMFGAMGGRLLSNLAAVGVNPEQITAVILTHSHGDHHGGLINLESKAAIFKNAQHFIHRREFDFWTGDAPDLSAELVSEDDRKTFIRGSQLVLGALKCRGHFIKPGEKLLAGLEIIDAPGHTPGHIALLFSSGNDQLLHFVDTVHHHEISFRHPEYGFFGDAQPTLATATRKKILDRAAADNLRVFGAHLPFPSLGRVRAINGAYEYRIEPWV